MFNKAKAHCWTCDKYGVVIRLSDESSVEEVINKAIADLKCDHQTFEVQAKSHSGAVNA